jgi:hypothetical protein
MSKSKKPFPPDVLAGLLEEAERRGERVVPVCYDHVVSGNDRQPPKSLEQASRSLPRPGHPATAVFFPYEENCLIWEAYIKQQRSDHDN